MKPSAERAIRYGLAGCIVTGASAYAGGNAAAAASLWWLAGVTLTAFGGVYAVWHLLPKLAGGLKHSRLRRPPEQLSDEQLVEAYRRGSREIRSMSEDRFPGESRVDEVWELHGELVERGIDLDPVTGDRNE